MAGREITAAETKVHGLPAAKLVGQRIDGVEARGKHLLIRLGTGQTLHSHLRMSGSWHVYPAGQRWRRKRAEARLVLTCGDRVAVCFNAPVVELLQRRAEGIHPALTGLGPDVLADPLALGEVRRRAATRPPDLALGELLLDQRVVAGIGNIYRCESLFLEGLSPWAVRSSITGEQLNDLVTTASRLMQRQLGPFTGHGEARWVYRRAGRPCRRCDTRIRSGPQGELARIAYWCPTCQP